jgi:hypothetical protein
MIDVFLYDQNGLKWKVPYSSLSFSEELNQGCSGQVNLKYRDFQNYVNKFGTYTAPTVLTSSLRDIKIYDDGQLYFYGFLKHFRLTEDSAGDATITLSFADWGLILSSRLSSTHFTDTDSGQIAWQIIEETQDKTYGDLGITQGTIETTKKRQRTLDHDNIRDVIIGMSKAKLDDGFDWDIDEFKRFNVYVQKGSVLPNIIFSDSNSSSWAFDQGLAAELANSCFIRGKQDTSEDENAVAPEVQVDDFSQADKWGLYEKFLTFSSVVEEDTLSAHGLEELAKASDPTKTTSLSFAHVDDSPENGGVRIRSYRLGDFVRIKKPSFHLDETWRVVKRTISTQNSKTTITVNINQLAPDDKYFKSQVDIERRLKDLSK